jgi:hypothetical protein
MVVSKHPKEQAVNLLKGRRGAQEAAAGKKGHFDVSPDASNDIQQPIPHDLHTRGTIECYRSEPESS